MIFHNFHEYNNIRSEDEFDRFTGIIIGFVSFELVCRITSSRRLLCQSAFMVIWAYIFLLKPTYKLKFMYRNLEDWFIFKKYQNEES